MKRLENALEAYFQKIGLQDQLKMRKWLLIWPQVVGSHISRYTRALVIKEKTLWIEVNDSSWLYHLTSLQDKIIKDFNKKAGFEVIEAIKLTNAGSFAEEREILITGQTLEQNAGQIKGQNESGQNSINDDVSGERDLVLEGQESVDLERFVSSVPTLYQDKYRKFIHELYLLQKKRLHKGAKICPFCRLPFYEHEMRDEICFLCYREREKWILILKPIFDRSPWLSYAQLKEVHNLSEELFYFCKEKIDREYYETILTFAGQEEMDDKAQEALQKYLQHYIMFTAGKEPALISAEDEFKALKVFAGLFDRYKTKNRKKLEI